ncbi:helix-hairpin-helix domain-containing protein [Pseudonocardia hispaniensis]|uniref:Helix-hairpin-helix domain-containing protein n=1 Tax=Pseudonocardia hispaniensis TaxID=904933 RepID=A0ABW1J7G9_9PSEU
MVGSEDAGRRLARVVGAPDGCPHPAGEPPTVPLPVTVAPAESRPGRARTRVGAALRGRAGSAVLRWVPEGWRDARLDPGRPGAVALALVTAIAAVLAAVGVWAGRPRPEPVAVPPAGLATVNPDPAGGAAPDPAAPLVVSVVGKVARPGLVRVPDGSRVADVIDGVGGPLPGVDLSGTNLARRVVDGEQIAIGVPVTPDGGGGVLVAGPGRAPSGTNGKIDLNRATVEQLDGLPGVGPVTASRIVEWRTRNGRFSRIEQLREIEGIGARRFGQLRDLVTV